MYPSALRHIQKAVYAALTGNAPLMALITGVYDSIPDATDPPYVHISSDTEIANGTFSKDGWDCTITLQVYSLGIGFKEALTIADAVTTVLHRATLTLDSGSCCYCQKEYQETLTPDGILRQVPLRFRVIAME